MRNFSFAYLSLLAFMAVFVLTRLHRLLPTSPPVGGGSLVPFLESFLDYHGSEQHREEGVGDDDGGGGDEPPRKTTYRPPQTPDTVESLDDLLLPMQVLEEYKKYHSADALHRERSADRGGNGNRTYALGMYQCPLAAGNRLHEFVNQLLWAVLTNRTFLWSYWDDQTCLKYAPDKMIELHTCEMATTDKASKATCDEMLNLAPWIPSYDEFSASLQLPQPVTIPAVATLPTPTARAIQRGAKPVVVDVKYGSLSEPKVAIFMRYQNRISYLGDPEVMSLKLATAWGRQAAEKLFSLGEEFLYGLLLRSSFDFTEKIRQSVIPDIHKQQNDNTHDDSMYTVAMHSRHNESDDTGCNVASEQSCLGELLEKRMAWKRHRSCRVALMSDRECTIANLRTWLEGEPYSCDVRVAPHEAGTGTFEEHGPFAGAGYFQDLVLASAVTRHGVVGSLEDPSRYGEAWRSSSSMLLELVDYERKMEAWMWGIDPATLPHLDQCTIQLPMATANAAR